MRTHCRCLGESSTAAECEARFEQVCLLRTVKLTSFRGRLFTSLLKEPLFRVLGVLTHSVGAIDRGTHFEGLALELTELGKGFCCGGLEGFGGHLASELLRCSWRSAGGRCDEN